jgi:adenine deaminase
MKLEEKIKASRGVDPADLLLKNGQIVNVFTGEIYPGNVAVRNGCIAGMGDYAAREELDVSGCFIAPGLMDAHVHIESSMVTIPEYARAVVPLGTTAVFIDPHEIANVHGLEGIRFMLASARYTPLDVFVMASSCVPATDMETSGARLAGSDIAALYGQPDVLGLAEMMNFPGVINLDPDVLEEIAISAGRVIDGHCPGLTGRDLAAYIAAGIQSDHESTTLEEAREKVRNGMMVAIREGTAARNLDTLLPLVTPENADRFMFCTDDRHPYDLIHDGHINYLVRRAVELGLAPALAVRLATLNTARYFRQYDRGAIAPGYRADLVIFEDFADMKMRFVFKDGQVVSREGRLTVEEEDVPSAQLRSSINVNWLEMPELDVTYREDSRIRVIEVNPGQLVTGALELEPMVQQGKVVQDIERDILKLAVAERHMASGNVGIGFVKGFGLKQGAIASSVAHDSHNIIAVGTKDTDMMTAIIEIVRLRGGLVAVVDDEVVGSLSLPIGGLMSDQPIETVSSSIEDLKHITREMGCPMEDPFMQLSFLALPVIPTLKLTDRGLVDVAAFDFTSLFV